MITLMYHSIIPSLHVGEPACRQAGVREGAIPPNREAGAQLYDLSVDDFQSHMQCLKNSGKAVLLTFDDGEMNNYDLAFPVLKKHGIKAYFFIIVQRVGKEGYMGWTELKNLSDAGMSIGSHGLTHQILTQLKDFQVVEELKQSKEILEKNLGITINDFSAPRGFCNDKIIQMAYDAGYKNVFISDKPKFMKSICIPRVAVKGNWTLKRFQQALEGHVPTRELVIGAIKNAVKLILKERGYNWLRKNLLH